MRRHFFPILIILLVTLTLIANSFHRHGDAAGVTKCPVCSGKYISASTHATIVVTAPKLPDNIPLLPAVVAQDEPSIALTASLHDRAPPACSL
jgi:hypothetical protein